METDFGGEDNVLYVTMEKLISMCGEHNTQAWGLVEKNGECLFGPEERNSTMIFSVWEILEMSNCEERLKGWSLDLLYVIFWSENIGSLAFMNWCIFTKDILEDMLDSGDTPSEKRTTIH